MSENENNQDNISVKEKKTSLALKRVLQMDGMQLEIISKTKCLDDGRNVVQV